jgi:ferric-dicitrate binding protein FerR (iron transport regulator)
MDYTNYTAEDLVMEPSFRKWVKREDPAAIDFWERWLARHPEKIPAVNEAKALLRKLPDACYHLDKREFQKMWANITLNVQEESQHIATSTIQPASAKVHVVFFKHYRKVAAAVIVLLISAVSLMMLYDSTSYNTAYGETQQIILPDGSEVMLNAHSSLTYPAFWQWRKTREVWLTGEAFFEVRKAEGTGGKKFIVHTSLLDVEVLGTSFNVNTRRGKTQVVLNTGTVQLHTSQGEKRQNVQMQPGDLVEFSSKKVAFTKQGVNPEAYSSWKDNKFLCNGTPLGKIAEMAQDRFGLNIQFEDVGLSAIEISGTLPLDNADVFLEVLKESIGKQITKNEDQIIIHKK